MTERWQHELGNLREIKPPEDLLDRPPLRVPCSRPRSRVRRVASGISVALAAFLVLLGIAVPLKILWPLAEKNKTRPSVAPASSPTWAGIPDVAEISCTGGKTQVLTPEVRPQSDGVHMDVQSSDRNLRFEINGPGSLGGGTTFISRLPVGSEQGFDMAPGKYLVSCEKASGVTLTEGSAAAARAGGQPLSVVDPEGLYVPFDLHCDQGTTHLGQVVDGTEDPADQASEVLRRAFVGVRPQDTVTQAGYGVVPSGVASGGRSMQLVRDGRTIALFGIGPQRAHYWIAIDVACKEAGLRYPGDLRLGPIEHMFWSIGNPERPLATSYELPGYQHCSPYEDPTCTPVWISYEAYAKARGEDSPKFGYPPGTNNPDKWCSEANHYRGCQLGPWDMPQVVFMAATDARRWFGLEGCGQSYETMCRWPLPTHLPVGSPTQQASPSLSTGISAAIIYLGGPVTHSVEGPQPGTVQVLSGISCEGCAGGPVVVAASRTVADGERAEIPLAPGTYSVSAKSGDAACRGASVTVPDTPGFVPVRIICDIK